jgi:DNA-binding LacI/PurR family transcriptional regulator
MTDRNSVRGPLRRGEIHRQLESAVISGGFPPGELLPPERELMQRFHVTRTTIRRALLKLTRAGLLTCRPRIGYEVPAVVRGGRPVQGRAIGLIWENMPSLAGRHSFLTTLEQVVAEAGHTLMVAANSFEAARENEAIRRLRAAGMAGLIIAPARRGGRSAELERWIREGRPVVLHGHPGRWVLPDALAGQCSRVDVDNEAGVQLLLDLLRRHGHRTVGFVSQESLAGSERFAAFRRLAQAAGLETRSAWQVGEIGWEAAGGAAALAALQRGGALPTAVFCSHGVVAGALLAALRAAGRRCPEAISVVSFADGRPVEGAATCTAVSINSEQQSREMMRLLSRQFAGLGASPEQVRVAPVLLDRGSVGAPPVRGA